MSAPASPPSDPVDRVDISVPLRTGHVATLRTVASSLGADAGFSIDEIDDVRLGLSEVLSALADSVADDDRRVTASFTIRPGELHISIRPDGTLDPIEFDELAAGILRSVVDAYEVSDDGVTLLKRGTESGRAVEA